MKNIAIDIILQDWEEKKEEFIEYANCPDSYNRKVKTKSDFRVFLNSLEEDEFILFCQDGKYDYDYE